MKTTILLLAALCAGLQTIAQTAAGTSPRLVPTSHKVSPRDTTAAAKLRLVSLQQSIHHHYNQQLAAELSEFSDSRKGEWLKYLPNVGTTYTLEGNFRPTISFSSNTIYRAKKDKQTREAKRHSIEKKIRLEEQKTLAAVQNMVTEYHIRLRELETQKLILETDRQLHAIQKDKYERSEIPPSDYLPAYKKWLQVELGFRQLEDELVLLRGRILEESFYYGGATLSFGN